MQQLPVCHLELVNVLDVKGGMHKGRVLTSPLDNPGYCIGSAISGQSLTTCETRREYEGSYDEPELIFNQY